MNYPVPIPNQGTTLSERQAWLKYNEGYNHGFVAGFAAGSNRKPRGQHRNLTYVNKPVHVTTSGQEFTLANDTVNWPTPKSTTGEK
jgi:hypothetical protein